MAALAARDMGSAASALRTAAAGLAAAEMPWLALANAELGLGEHVAAEHSIDRQLELTPRELGALLLKGMLRERAGDMRAATSFFSAALGEARRGAEVPPPLAALHAHAERALVAHRGDYAAHLDQALGNDLSPTMREALGLLRGEREVDLQQPSVFYYPGLPQRRFYDPADFPWLADMLALLPRMQAELAAMRAGHEAGFEPYVTRRENRPAPMNPLLGDKAWSAFWFWRDGAVVEENARACSATMAALEHAPLVRIPGRAPSAHWSRLRPGAHIAPHVGMLNTRLIVHIPILTAPDCLFRVGSETRTWEDGVPLLFDDSFDHEARNGGTQDRVILLFEIWKPEIPEHDREALSRLFQAIDGFGE